MSLRLHPLREQASSELSCVLTRLISSAVTHSSAVGQHSLALRVSEPC